MGVWYRAVRVDSASDYAERMEAKATAEAWFRVERWALILLSITAVCLLAAIITSAIGARRQAASELELEAEGSEDTSYPAAVPDQLEGAAAG